MKIQVHELVALSDFSCLGGDCPVTCCRDWDRIVVDEPTLKKWSALKKHNHGLPVLEMVGTEKDGTSVMKKHNNECVALDKDGLCKIQKRYDHDCLSHVCQNFPRIGFSNRLRAYRSASFSCPEIVRKVLFADNNEMFVVHEEHAQDGTGRAGQGSLQYDLDLLLDAIFSREGYPLGIMLFFISDLFAALIGLAESGQITEDTISQVRQDIDENLGDLLHAVNEGKLSVHPVTAGSFWRSIYQLCVSRKVNEKYLLHASSELAMLVSDHGDSFDVFEKIYSVIVVYRSKAFELIRETHSARVKMYARMLLINKGFPLNPEYPHLMVLVDSMICLSVLQMLFWIEVNKNGLLSDEFVRDCIVEVDKKFVLHDGVIRMLKEDPHMMQIDRYCNVFIDMF